MIRYFHGFQSIDELDFEKVDGLMPAIVQDCQTGMVLMMGYQGVFTKDFRYRLRYLLFKNKTEALD